MVLAVTYPWASASSYLSSQSVADSRCNPTYVQVTYVGVRADATLTRSQIEGTRACARVDTTPCCVSLRHIKMSINASRAECGPESPSLPRQEASQQKSYVK